MLDMRVKEANARFLDALQYNDTGMLKSALDGGNDYIRKEIKESSFFRQILPEEPITNDDLDNSLTHTKPWKIIEVEPDSTGATTVQFGKLPDTVELEGHKIAVYFNQIESTRVVKNINELRLWKMDIRQILLDKQKKEIEWEEDRRFIWAVNNAVVAPHTIGASGSVAWWEFDGGMSRENLLDAVGIMEQTPAYLDPKIALVNTKTRREIAKWGRDEAGGDFAQDIIENGWSRETFAGLRWLATKKYQLVPNGAMYMFTDPEYLGKHYILEDVTMYVKNEAFNVSSFLYKTSGGVIGNVGGVARADFNPTGLSNDGARVTIA